MRKRRRTPPQARPPRALAFSFALPLALALASPFACGGEGNSPDSCRSIEDVRCEQAPMCPALGVTDVVACQRFYRDQCLRGLAIENDPGSPAVEACVRALKGAGECAGAGVATAAECGRYQGAPPPCEALQFPERIVECAFLLPPPPPPPPPTAGAAGAAGTAGAAGAAGTAGAAGASGMGGAGGAGGDIGQAGTAGAGAGMAGASTFRVGG